MSTVQVAVGPIGFHPLVDGRVVVVALVVALLVVGVQALRRQRGRAHWLLRAGLLGLVALAALGPQVGTEAISYRVRPQAQVVVALDRTASMSARDGTTTGRSRLELARADLAALAALVPAPIALVTWATRARIVEPFTTDDIALGRAVNLVDTERPAASVGSRVDRPLATVQRLVSQATAEHPDRPTYLVLLSDGEDTAPGQPDSYAVLKGELAGGVVVGYGSDAGAPVPLTPGDPQPVVPDPRTGRPALSRRDPANLRRVARQLGGAYTGREDVASWRQVVPLLTPSEEDVVGPARPRDLTWVIGLALLLLLLPEVRGASRSLREVLALRKLR